MWALQRALVDRPSCEYLHSGESGGIEPDVALISCPKYACRSEAQKILDRARALHHRRYPAAVENRALVACERLTPRVLIGYPAGINGVDKDTVFLVLRDVSVSIFSAALAMLVWALVCLSMAREFALHGDIYYVLFPGTLAQHQGL